MKLSTTKQVIERLGVSRAWIQIVIANRQIKPVQEIHGGRVHNLFTEDHIKALMMGRRGGTGIHSELKIRRP